ncbi:GtrA family protein [Rhodopseudomonas pseudopalustris]|uniref:Putative flippase GtrA (Transmembrane translocase of bactoprenol-linked glucose) n=1 Tax=Rhodopseudomonas pseudopalustris TaxID=1513892 RepID=A0A1H8ULV5_9BRAD|nr:GtrA family protein [Rhodopseudomonas pseudopalustris]SEP03987.1 Putative flippase GtrA (transmembrane translocase of bactoprenol-linked glucose) [Rhodopseudomonas pseudopalustris]
MHPQLRRLSDLRVSRSLASKMVAFASIGVVNTFIDLGVFALAYKVFELPIVLANVLAWLVAASCSYVMNTMITFRVESGRVLKRKDYLSFVASGLLGLIANTTTLVVLSAYVPVFTAKLVAIVVSFVVNFSMSHLVVFRRKPAHGADG